MPKPKPMSGAERIARERQRQIEVEGWTPEHDSHHASGQLASAATAYIIRSITLCYRHGADGLPLEPPFDWPWGAEWWKPSLDPVRNLEKAGALIAAEIDRLLAKKPESEVKQDTI